MTLNFDETTLDEVCIQITDGSHNSPPSVEKGLPMASVKDLTPYGINLNTCRHISEADFNTLVRQGCKPRPGDILIAKDGASALDTVCEVKHPINVVLLSSIAILRPNTKKIISPYLRYYMDCETTRQYMKSGFITGAAITRVVLKDFKRCKVRFPPLPTQRSIAGILSAYDDLIENNARRIAILEEMARTLYHEWFVKFRFPGHEDVKMVESELGMIPEGWGIAKVGQLVELSRAGITPDKFKDEIFTHYSIPAFDEEQIPVLEPGENIKSNKFLVPNGSVLVSKINPRIPRIWLPMDTDSKLVVASTEFLIILPKAPLTREFIFCYCRSQDFINNFAGKAIGTSTSHQRAKSEDLMNMLIVLPDSEIIKNFTDIARPLCKFMQDLRVRNASLRRARDLLLPKLITGEIDVSGWAGGVRYEEMAESVVSGPGARRVAEARPDVGAITPIDKDALQWRSLWDEE